MKPSSSLIHLTEHLLACSCLFISNQAARAYDAYIPITTLKREEITDLDEARMKKGMSTIPPSVQKTIAGAGVTILLTPKFIDAEPESSGRNVFRNGGTTDNVGGVFEAGKNRVVIPEKASWHNGVPRPQGDYLIGVVRHELGHAYDHSLHHASGSEAFKQAYTEDFKHFSNTKCRKYQYFITGVSKSDANEPTDSGHAECFATMFEQLVTPASKKKQELIDSFPHVIAYIQTLDPSLKEPAPESEIRRSAPVSMQTITKANNMALENPEYSEAKRLYDSQDFTGALYKLNRIIHERPNAVEAILLRANCELWLKQFQNAVHDADAVIKKDPRDPRGYRVRANADAWLGAISKQKDDLKRAEELERATESR